MDNDYTDLRDRLDRIVNELEGLSVPDEDIDNTVNEATELLRHARDTSGARA